MAGRERGQPAALQFSRHWQLRAGVAYGRGLAYLDLLAARNRPPARPLADQHRRGHPRLIANIYFYPIDTPLKQFVAAHGNLMRHCEAMRWVARQVPH